MSLYKLRDWIEKEKLDWSYLSKNIHFMHLLNEVSPTLFWMISDKIDWYLISMNPDAIELLEKNQDKIYWSMLSHNSSATYLINKNKDKYKIYSGGSGKRSEPETPDRRSDSVSRSNNGFLTSDSDSDNESFYAKKASRYNKRSLSDSDTIFTIDSNGNKIYTSEMQYSKMIADHVNKKNGDVMTIDLCHMSRNTTDMNFLEQNPEKINWYALSENPNAIHLLEKNQNKIDWKIISQNPCIFELNYDFIRKRMNLIKEELIAKAGDLRNEARSLHPNRIQKCIMELILEDDL
jgi:hypothetical protein